MEAPALNPRQELLADIYSKVTLPQLKTLHERFDIPRGYKLTTPTRSHVIYDHDESRHPLYIQHLEYSQRLPLHPFLDRVFSALGVSPMLMNPNAITTLVGFVVICHWLGIQPSLSVLGHMISIKDWKEKFVWVSGDDVELGCSIWPEVIKEGLMMRVLSANEKKAREAAEKRVATLEVELSRNDGKWLRELGMKDDLIKGYKLHCSKQSSTIAELKDEVGRLEKEIAERDGRIKYLSEEVAMQKRRS